MLKALLNQLFCFVLCLKCFFFVCYYLRIFRGFKRSDNLKINFSSVCLLCSVYFFILILDNLLAKKCISDSFKQWYAYVYACNNDIVHEIKSCYVLYDFFCELCFDKFRVLCDLFNGRMNQINTSVLFVDYFKTFILERYFAN